MVLMEDVEVVRSLQGGLVLDQVKGAVGIYAHEGKGMAQKVLYLFEDLPFCPSVQIYLPRGVALGLDGSQALP